MTALISPKWKDWVVFTYKSYSTGTADLKKEWRDGRVLEEQTDQQFSTNFRQDVISFKKGNRYMSSTKGIFEIGSKLNSLAWRTSVTLFQAFSGHLAI